MRKEKISAITEKHTEDKSEIDSKDPIPGKQENVEKAHSKKSLKRVRFAEDPVYSSATTDPIPQKRLKSCLRESTATPIPKKTKLVRTKTPEYRAKYDLRNIINSLNSFESQTICNSPIVSPPMGFFDNPSHKAKQENDVVKTPTPREGSSP